MDRSSRSGAAACRRSSTEQSDPYPDKCRPGFANSHPKRPGSASSMSRSRNRTATARPIDFHFWRAGGPSEGLCSRRRGRPEALARPDRIGTHQDTVATGTGVT